jgi:multimeric flavodoxin WrbA
MSDVTNILVISGARNPGGQTARAVKAYLEGASAAGAQADTVFLPVLDIQRCRQCDDDGWGKCNKEGACVIEDDFAAVVDRMRSADAVVFANPVYFADLTESLKAFLDRLRRICMHPDGAKWIQGKPAVIIAVAGGGGGGAPLCCYLAERTLQRCGMDVVDAVAARRQNLPMKLETLRIAGEWLGRGGFRED